MNGKQDGYVTKRALVSGTLLNDKYQIADVLGEGGFGITYEGKHIEYNCKVAIKEYFPFGLASRECADSNQNLHIFRGENEKYQKGKERFLKEAEILKEYQYLQGIVKVMDCFECNQTAYIVMEYVEGITLQQYIKEYGRLSYQELLQLLEPVMKSLAQIHRQGVIHKDISPSNLLIGLDNEARLIDFGAADLLESRHQNNNTVILKTGYAPPEQYLIEGKQGAWTDVYAMSAMMYMALTGKTPVDSVARLQGTKLYPDINEINGLEKWQINALLTGMDLKIANRYKNMEELLEALTVGPLREDEHTRYYEETATTVKKQIQRLNGEHKMLIRIAIIVLLLIFVGVMMWMVSKWSSIGKNDNSNDAKTNLQTTIENTSTEETPDVICVMPNVVGSSEEDARKRIIEVDEIIEIVVKYEYNDTAKRGVVVAQDIAASTKYNQGAIEELVLTVSMGTEERDNTSQSENKASTTQSVSKKKTSTEDEDTYSEFEEYDSFTIE